MTQRGSSGMAESAGGLSVWDEGASLTRNTPCLMCSLTHSHAHSLACTLTHSHAHSLTHSLTCSLTRMLTYSLTHSLTQAHARTHVGTHTVKYMNIYNSLTHKNNTSIRSKNMYLMVLSTETVYSLQKLKCFALSSQSLGRFLSHIGSHFKFLPGWCESLHRQFHYFP